jgi:PIF1-like helicase
LNLNFIHVFIVMSWINMFVALRFLKHLPALATSKKLQPTPKPPTLRETMIDSNTSHIVPVSDRTTITEPEPHPRLRRDVMDQHDRPFGGVVICLCGDYRQILPVIPTETHDQIAAAMSEELSTLAGCSHLSVHD